MKDEVKKSYFVIKLDDLPSDKDVLPFDLYIMSENLDHVDIFHRRNLPIDNEKINSLKTMLAGDKKLVIKNDHKKTFEKFIQSDNISLRLEDESRDDKDDESYQLTFKKSFSEDNYESILNRVRKDILGFSLKESSFNSMIIDLVKSLLIEDCIITRIVATTYIVAKILKINEEETLCNLIAASFFNNYGRTQYNNLLNNIPISDLTKDLLKERNKDYLYSLYLLKKIGMKNDVLMIINDSHEQVDGGGRCGKKKGDFVKVLPSILGSVSSFYHYQMGYVTGEKVMGSEILSLLKSNNEVNGLEKKYHPMVMETLVGLIDNNC